MVPSPHPSSDLTSSRRPRRNPSASTSVPSKSRFLHPAGSAPSAQKHCLGRIQELGTWYASAGNKRTPNQRLVHTCATSSRLWMSNALTVSCNDNLSTQVFAVEVGLQLYFTDASSTAPWSSSDRLSSHSTHLVGEDQFVIFSPPSSWSPKRSQVLRASHYR